MSRSVSRALALCLLFSLVLAGAAAAEEGLSFRATQVVPSPTGSAVAPKFTDEPADAFMLPMFKLDRSNAQGETTLIAVRNTTDQGHDLSIEYWVDGAFSPSDTPDLVQSFSLNPHQVKTINLRDLPEITGGAGGDAVIRGWLRVDHADGVGDVFSADWFRVNPAEDFASGGRMVDVDHSGLCTFWDLRYLIGSGFDGGTRLEVFVDTPLGGNTSTDDPSFTVVFIDEAGVPQGGVDVFSSRQVAELDVEELLAVLPGTPAQLGAMEITFHTGTNGGLVTGTYRAEGRYSIGLNATCLVP